MQSENADGLKRIVVGLDGSEPGAAALSWAVHLARIAGAHVTAVHAFDVPPLAYPPDVTVATPVLFLELHEDLQRALEEEWCAPLREAGIPYDAVLEDGRPSTVLAEVADRVDAGLIVVGRRGRRGTAELLLGSVSHELTHHSRRPLTIVPHGARPEGEPPARPAAPAPKGESS